VPEGELPQLRASDADRERVAEVLRRAAGDGQLTVQELDERLDRAYAARTRGELAPLTADLQTPAEAELAAPEPRGRTFTVRRGGGGARWLVAILGGCERKGRWRLAERSTSVNVMGGSELDLTQVELAADEVELTVVAIMGGSDIRVPDGLNVEVSELALLGGNSVDVGATRPAPGGPVLRLRLLSIMGGIDVKRGRKRTKAERRALKEQERRRQLGR